MESGSFLDPLAATGRYLRGLLPTKLALPKINFMWVHYIYITACTIVGSIILYPLGMSYIDALVFAAGSSTQSGLNPVDINLIYLYQQVVIMLISDITNPVFINTVVVMVRLYWFEKRFASIVAGEKEKRRTRAQTITRTKSDARSQNEDMEAGRNRSVAGQSITVLHDTTRTNAFSSHTVGQGSDKTAIDSGADSVQPSSDSNGSCENSDSAAPDEEKHAHFSGANSEERSHVSPTTPNSPRFLGINPRLNREITFADEVASPPPTHARQAAELPSVAERTIDDRDKHIEFLQRQQKARSEGAALRIPGPRAFERGEGPQALDDDDDDLDRNLTLNTLSNTSSSQRRRTSDNLSEEVSAIERPTPNRAITIATPAHPGRHAKFDDDDDGPKSAGFVDKLKHGLHHRRSLSRLSLKTVTGSIGRSFNKYGTNASQRVEEPMPYLSWEATTGRNSAFMGLSSEQREELGGIEYRSLKLLLKILIGYYVGFHLLGSLTYIPWILRTYWKDQILAQYAIDPVWWGFFTASSMFTDLGFTLTPTSMNEFNTATLPLLLGSFLIVIGNTGFPCMLRFIIWLLSKLFPYGSREWEELKFLLDHPRRCFTLLFPSKATWWLFWVLVLFNGIDLIFFIILDLNDPVVTSIPPAYRVLDGWFQAVSTRTAGFSCVNLAGLHPGIQVSYLLMMYISVFPIAISVRRTNVYEEKSLGIFSGEEIDPDEGDPSYVGQHLRRQLSFDLWYVFLGLFIIAIVEGDRLGNPNDYGFSIFAVLFEIVSAYGTVGLSLGYPNTNASLTAQFRVISKLVIAAMMIRGRHRGLPYALDRAILLPSDNLNKQDEEVPRQTTRRGSLFAEANASELERGGTWQDASLDNYGLPKQHTRPTSASFDPMTAAAGGESEGLRRVNNRRKSSTGGGGSARRRSTSLGRFVSGALAAGPTLPKRGE